MVGYGLDLPGLEYR